MTILDSLDFAGASSALQHDVELAGVVVSHGAVVAGLLLDRRAQDGFSPSDYWNKLCREFKKLICNQSAPEYAPVREQAAKAYHAGQVLGLPLLCAALAAKVNLNAALITPFVALLIVGLAKVNVEAWCKTANPDDPASSLFEKGN